MKLYIIHEKKAHPHLTEHIRRRFARVRIPAWTEQETSYASSVEDIIDASDVVVAILSPAAMQNPFVRAELEYALQTKEELLVPVLAETTAVPFELPPYVDMREFADTATESEALKERIREIFLMIYDPFLEHAEAAYEEAEAAYEEESNFTTRCRLEGVCLMLGDFVRTIGGVFAGNRAKVYYLKALEIASESDEECPCFNSRHDMALACLSLGELAIEQKKSVTKWREQAISWFKQAAAYSAENLREQPQDEATKTMRRCACYRLSELLAESHPDEAAAWKRRFEAVI